MSTFLMRCIRNVPSVMELTIITLMLKKSVCIVWGEALQPLEYLFANDKGQQSVIYQERWKFLVEPGWHIQTSQRPGIVYELYDLWADPAEVHNVAEKYPEIVHNLQKACADWQQENSIVDYSDILSIRPDHRK